MKDYFSTAAIPAGERAALEAISANFESFPTSTQQKLANFPNWVRHRDLARFLYRAEIFRSVVNVPGAVFECGVLFGGGLASWLHLSEIYEPVNFSRRIYGFDTFEGFRDVGAEDRPDGARDEAWYRAGHFDVGQCEVHLRGLVPLIEETRKVQRPDRVKLVKGDAAQTVGAELEADKSLLVALLYLDMDLYEPTRAVLEACRPRMPKGAVVVLDELCCPDWPGETQALLDVFGGSIRGLQIERSPTVPHMAVLRL